MNLRVTKNFNIELEKDFDIHEWAFAIVPLFLRSGYSRGGFKLGSAFHVGPFSAGVEFRFFMGQK